MAPPRFHARHQCCCHCSTFNVAAGCALCTFEVCIYALDSRSHLNIHTHGECNVLSCPSVRQRHGQHGHDMRDNDDADGDMPWRACWTRQRAKRTRALCEIADCCKNVTQTWQQTCTYTHTHTHTNTRTPETQATWSVCLCVWCLCVRVVHMHTARIRRALATILSVVFCCYFAISWWV